MGGGKSQRGDVGRRQPVKLARHLVQLCGLHRGDKQRPLLVTDGLANRRVVPRVELLLFHGCGGRGVRRGLPA